MGYWESALARLQSDERQLPLVRDILDDLKSITLEEIQNLAREVFGPQDTTNYFFTMPQAAAEEEIRKQEPESTPADGGYTIISTRSTMAEP